jgi:sugar phosphate isomerase/epimerase
LDRVKASGIPCESCNNFFPKTIRLTGDDADTGAILEYVAKALGRAQKLGAKTVAFGSGPAKNIPEGFPFARGYEQIVRLLKDINPIAKNAGITVMIEPLRRAECNVINSFEDGCRLAEEVNSSHIRVLVDYYHFSEEAEPVSHLLKDGEKWLRHVHIANPAGRIFPKRHDGHDYEAFFAALKTIGYAERMSCEAYSKDFAKDAADFAAFIRQEF